LRSSKYLDNLIEPDHRGIKSRTGSMLGLKDFDCAATTTSGIELLRLLAKDNSPWSVSILETELPLQSGMRPSSHRIYSSSGHAAPLTHTCTRTAQRDCEAADYLDEASGLSRRRRICQVADWPGCSATIPVSMPFHSLPKGSTKLNWSSTATKFLPCGE
jgi:hypothetical protein